MGVARIEEVNAIKASVEKVICIFCFLFLRLCDMCNV